METRKLRIRRCDGNKSAWMLVAISTDGSESSSFGSYTTAYSIDSLLRSPDAKHLLPTDGTPIELVLS